ncbi:hypothetical protein LTR08_000454 [Meristemomyces frigidus]|nr:hypothetical protein LTR08_000454 [Meristemomyces frigidus]
MRLPSSTLVALSLVSHAHSKNSTLLNPILPGFHPDPSCISVPEPPYNHTFFCASSSFSLFPGIPLHASKDLVNWRLISNALARPEQLPALALTNKSTSGIWAPTLRHHAGVFYILTTLVFDDQPQTNLSRWDNFLLSTTDPFNSSSWSQPIHFNFTGYDTSPFWNPQDNTTYVTGSHPWELQPGITLAPLNLTTGAIGPLTNIWNGTGGLAPEGPHLYFHPPHYYLMIAEGGTGVNHMETIARAPHPNGPYTPNPSNPILTQANTTSYFQTVGHADLFQDARGQWWGCALSTRSGPEYAVYPMGRETVLAPVTWETGGWPVWSNVSGHVSSWPLPAQNVITEGEGPLITAAELLDFAPGTRLPPQLVHWRLPIADNYVVSPPNHAHTLQLTASVLNLTGLDGNYAGPAGQTFVGRRQVDTFFTYSVDLDFSDLREEGDEAGVSLFLTQNHHFDLGVVLLPAPNTNLSTQYPSSSPPAPPLTPHLRLRGISYLPVPPALTIPLSTFFNQTLPHPSKTLTLQIKASNTTHYALSAGPPGHEHLLQTVGWTPAAAVSFGFTGTLCGVFATTNGRVVNGSAPSALRAWVGGWRYEGQGQVRS